MILTIQNPPITLWNYRRDSLSSSLQKFGFEIYENDSSPATQADYIYVIANSDGTFKTPTITGYTKIAEVVASEKFFANTDDKIDLTGAGYSPLSVDEIVNHPDVGSKIFFEQIFDGNVLVGIRKLCIYSVAPTGECFNQIVKYVDWLQYARKNADGSYRFDSNGEYIIDRIN